MQRKRFSQKDRDFLQAASCTETGIERFEDLHDVSMAPHQEDHPSPEKILTRPDARMICNRKGWSLAETASKVDVILDSELPEELRDAPGVNTSNRKNCLDFSGTEIRADFCFCLFTEKDDDFIGYSNINLSASIDAGETSLVITLESIWIRPKYRGVGFGSSIATHSAEHIANVYKYFAKRFPSNQVYVYSDYMSPGGERCAEVFFVEIEVARDSLQTEIRHKLPDIFFDVGY